MRICELIGRWRVRIVGRFLVVGPGSFKTCLGAWRDNPIVVAAQVLLINFEKRLR